MILFLALGAAQPGGTTSLLESVGVFITHCDIMQSLMTKFCVVMHAFVDKCNIFICRLLKNLIVR